MVLLSRHYFTDHDDLEVGPEKFLSYCSYRSNQPLRNAERGMSLKFCSENAIKSHSALIPG